MLYYNGETVSRLSPIKGYAELLADGTAGEPQTVREYGSLILKNAEHTEKLINDLKLDLAAGFRHVSVPSSAGEDGTLSERAGDRYCQ